MLDSPIPDDKDVDDRIDTIVRTGPTGTLAVTGFATAIVVLIWFAFYFLVFIPRGAAP
jgi:hypothetical protein